MNDSACAWSGVCGSCASRSCTDWVTLLCMHDICLNCYKDGIDSSNRFRCPFCKDSWDVNKCYNPYYWNAPERVNFMCSLHGKIYNYIYCDDRLGCDECVGQSKCLWLATDLKIEILKTEISEFKKMLPELEDSMNQRVLVHNSCMSELTKYTRQVYEIQLANVSDETMNQRVVEFERKIGVFRKEVEDQLDNLSTCKEIIEILKSKMDVPIDSPLLIRFARAQVDQMQRVKRLLTGYPKTGNFKRLVSIGETPTQFDVWPDYKQASMVEKYTFNSLSTNSIQLEEPGWNEIHPLPEGSGCILRAGNQSKIYRFNGEHSAIRTHDATHFTGCSKAINQIVFDHKTHDMVSVNVLWSKFFAHYLPYQHGFEITFDHSLDPNVMTYFPLYKPFVMIVDCLMHHVSSGGEWYLVTLKDKSHFYVLGHRPKKVAVGKDSKIYILSLIGKVHVFYKDTFETLEVRESVCDIAVCQKTGLLAILLWDTIQIHEPYRHKIISSLSLWVEAPLRKIAFGPSSELFCLAEKCLKRF